MAYEIDFGYGLTQTFGKPAPGSLAGAMHGMGSTATGPISTPVTTGGSPAVASGYISDMSDPDRYRKMADSLRQDWLSRTAPAGSLSSGSGRLPSQPPTNNFGNDMSAANRFNAMADSMRRERLSYSAPAGSLSASMGANNMPAGGDLNQLPTMGSSPASSPPMVNPYGHDMTTTNRLNSIAADMKRERLAYSAPPPAPMGGSMPLGGPPDAEPVDTRTWGDLNQMPAFRQVQNVGAMGGNF